MDPRKLREPFERWLAARWPDAEGLRVAELASPKSGFSALTLVAPVHLRRDGREREEKVVLRVESPDPAVYPQQAPGLDVEVEIQYRVMDALARTGKAPLAGLIGYEPDASVLGAPFFAMEYVAGEVAVENPPYTQQGFFRDAAPDERRRMVEQGLAALAALHEIDWREAGLGWLVAPGARPDIARQLEIWQRFADRELAGREHPVLRAGFEHVRAELPEGLASRFSWGDSRLGNIIFRDGRVACLTDFENAAIAPAEIDLGWWLMFDRTMHESVGAERLPGEPTREQQRAHYARCAGRDPGDTHVHEVFAAVRYSAIVVRVMNRAVARGFLPADQKIWLTNPASAALADLLALPRP
jgi:aminoglycoside phosphotransferase (APT) family kinase protein